MVQASRSNASDFQNAEYKEIRKWKKKESEEATDEETTDEELVPIPMPLTKADALAMKLKPDDLNIKTYNFCNFHYAVPCVITYGTKQQREEILRAIDSEWASTRRERRCLLPNGKGGFKICPDSNRCFKCPYADRKKSIDCRPVFLEDVKADDDGECSYEPPSPARTDIDAIENTTLEELIRYLGTFEDERYALIFQMLYDTVPKAEIARKLGLSWSGTEYLIGKVRKLAQEYYGSRTD